MDRRTIIAIFAFLAIYYLYYFVAKPIIFPEAPAEAPVAEVVPDAAPVSPATVPVPPDATPAAPVSPSLAVPTQALPFEACGWSGEFDSRLGALRSANLDQHEAPYAVTPIYMWVFNLVQGGPTTWRPYGEAPGRQPIASADARYLAMGIGEPGSAPAPTWMERTGDVITLRGVTAEGVEVSRILRPNKLQPCVVDVEVTWKNTSAARYGGPLWIGVHDRIADAPDAYAHFYKPYWSVDGSWNSYSFPKTGGYMGLYQVLDDPDRQDGVLDWFAMSDGYFSFVVVPRGTGTGRLVVDTIARGPDQEPLYGGHIVLDGGLDAGASITQTYSVYAGPNLTRVLSEVHPSLYSLVDLGWFAIFGWPLHWLLSTYHSFTGNWGLSIMLLTFTVKLLFFPLTQMAYISGQRMQALQPMMKEIREKFADNQEEANRRTMALFRENNVNPLGGCLPMVIQMPIWIALYRVLLTSVDLYHTEFLYLRDLSVADPYALLPLMVTGLMWVQQQMMPVGNLDPAQARIMKFMPLIFGLLFFSFPSGLALYTFVNMLLTIIQQWVIKRRFASVKPASPAAA